MLSTKPFSALIRPALVLVALFNLVMGVMGVSQSRTIAAEAGVFITPVWYGFAVIPPVIVALSACLLTDAALAWRNRLLPAILAIVSVISGGAGLLLYAVYDFEHLLNEKQMQGASQT